MRYVDLKILHARKTVWQNISPCPPTGFANWKNWTSVPTLTQAARFWFTSCNVGTTTITIRLLLMFGPISSSEFPHSGETHNVKLA